MAKILIIIPGLPKKNTSAGWSGMLNNFINEMSDNEIKIFCTSINAFKKSSSNQYFSKNGKPIYIFKRYLNIFDLFKRLISIIRLNLPVQSALFSPKYSDDYVFRNLYKECDYAIWLTSRVIAFQEELLKNEIDKIKFKHFYMVDSLYLAFKYRAKEQKNILLYYLYKRESLKLKYLERKYINTFNKITLFNISDADRFLDLSKIKKLQMHPLKPYLKFDKFKKIKFDTKNLKYIYLLGNFTYSPNLSSLKEFINFLENNNSLLKQFLYEKKIKFNILGFMNFLDKKILKKSLNIKKLEGIVEVSNPISNYEDIRKDALATISYVKTNYGRQTKDFDSLNLMLPILRYHNNNLKSSLSHIYKGKSFYKTFSTQKELITNLDNLLNKKQLIQIKKDILNQMSDEIKFNKKFYKDLLNN